MGKRISKSRRKLVSTMNALRPGEEFTWTTRPGCTTSMHPATLYAAIGSGELRKVCVEHAPHGLARFVTVARLDELSL